MFTKCGNGRLGLSAAAILMGILTAGSPALAGHDFRPPPPDCGGNWGWVDPIFEMRCRTITDPAVFETRCERIWIEPIYEIREVKVVVPAVFENRTRQVWRAPVVEYRSAPVAGMSFGGRRSQFAIVACVQPQPVVIRPGYWETVCERVCVRPETVRCEMQRACVRPGRWEMVERQVCVRPACTRTVEERVCVAPGHWAPIGRPAPRSGFGMNFNFRFGNGR